MQPLAEHARPQTFDDFVGQKHLWSAEAALRRLAARDQVRSVIFWGPPGCGKTSLALLIANHSQRKFQVLSAVNATVKDLRQVFASSLEAKQQDGKETLLFLDEVHRLSKNQQDVLLPALESGAIRFIGATTENPSFEVNPAILSRCLVFSFKPLEKEDMVLRLKSVVKKLEEDVTLTDELYQAIAQAANGDIRRALNITEAILASAERGKGELGLGELKAFGDTFKRYYDKKGAHHYDVASALIKSIRGSHPDAALHYLARMIDAGETPEFIARRLVIAAAEDIGNANPIALVVANSGFQAVHAVGYPEARIILGQLVSYLASSPKSNRAYLAIEKALADVRACDELAVPMHLRNAPTKFMKEHGYGKNYIYAHDDPEGARKMSYLPEKLRGKRYYEPSTEGSEQQLKLSLEKRRPTAD